MGEWRHTDLVDNTPGEIGKQVLSFVYLEEDRFGARVQNPPATPDLLLDLNCTWDVHAILHLRILGLLVVMGQLLQDKQLLCSILVYFFASSFAPTAIQKPWKMQQLVDESLINNWMRS